MEGPLDKNSPFDNEAMPGAETTPFRNKID